MPNFGKKNILNSIKVIASTMNARDSNHSLSPKVANAKYDTKTILASINEINHQIVRFGSQANKRIMADLGKYKLGELEPADFTFDIFSAFGIEDEPPWSRWISSLLDPKISGDLTRDIFWKALCRSAHTAHLKQQSDFDYSDSAITHDWQSLSNETIVSVASELSCQGGRIDIYIETPSTILIIENKLDAYWHDSNGKRQDLIYLKHGKRQCKKEHKQLALLLLSLKQNKIESRHGWDHTSYYELGKSLRQEIRSRNLDKNHNASELIQVWPLLATLRAIEKDLEDIPHEYLKAGWKGIPAEKMVAKLGDLASLNNYLKGGE